MDIGYGYEYGRVEFKTRFILYLAVECVGVIERILTRSFKLE